MQDERKLALSNIIQRNHLGALIFWWPDELVLTLGTESENMLPEGVRIIKYPWGMIDCPDPWSSLLNPEYMGLKLGVVHGLKMIF